ncbi:MAG: glycosyltransferase family 4 protein [Nannocystales bacterium]
MRLLMITQDFPPQTGGIQTYSAELGQRFAAACDRFEMVAPADVGHEAVDAELPYRVHRLPVPSDRMVFATLRSGAAIAKQGFDAVFHAQWYTLPAGLWLRRRNHVQRVFVAAHGRELLLNVVERVPAVGTAYAAARDAMLRQADLLMPVSGYTGGLLEASGVSGDAIHVAPNGVDAEAFRAADGAAFRAEHGLGDGPLVTTVCRLVPRKGIDTTLEAVAQLRERIPGLRYAIGGSGPDRQRLETRVRDLGLQDTVRFLGRVPDDQMANCMTAADVFCMPARSEPPDVEGFGLVFLEAGACETAVIGARAGGVPDAIVPGETGLLVEPSDPAGLADALHGLLTQPEVRARMGATARARIEAQCTWDHVAAGLLDAMRRSVGG